MIWPTLEHFRLGRRRSEEVAAGAAHALASLETGAVVAWGANDRGQLGLAAPRSEVNNSEQ